MKNRLRLALQKKGRLSEESLTLLQQCGLKFRIKPNSLLTHVDNFPIDLLFVRDDDIPTLVFDELCDGGIVGENMLLESALANPEKSYKTIAQLGNCTCRLSIAVPEAMDYQGLGSLDGKRIATSYPNLLKHYLKKQKYVQKPWFYQDLLKWLHVWVWPTQFAIWFQPAKPWRIINLLKWILYCKVKQY